MRVSGNRVRWVNYGWPAFTVQDKGHKQFCLVEDVDSLIVVHCKWFWLLWGMAVICWWSRCRDAEPQAPLRAECSHRECWILFRIPFLGYRSPLCFFILAATLYSHMHSLPSPISGTCSGAPVPTGAILIQSRHQEHPLLHAAICLASCLCLHS